ncbi:MAG: exodeoxyribonuclease VII large subunit [Pseudomonadota bacterium]
MTGTTESGHIYTVTGLTREIKALVEDRFPFVWITGEISNCSIPSSGHAYFSLKDTGAVIHCVMFKNQRSRLRFALENGIKVVGMGRISLYEPRGSYQLVFEHIEPDGTGALQIAFEQLKTRLSLEGLFDDRFKKKIPFLPEKISLITSPTGSVVRDILNVATRRFPTISLQVVPVRVQGTGAELDIVDALSLVNQIAESDLIIIARGGGSLEDLSAFNSESVARAVFDSEIPVISAIGHETDYSICDFVADLRAPTPSAAAELAVPEKSALTARLTLLINRLQTSGIRLIADKKKEIRQLTARLKSPVRIIDDFRFRLEEYETRIKSQMDKTIRFNREKRLWIRDALYSNNPGKQIRNSVDRTTIMTRQMISIVTSSVQHSISKHAACSAKLDTLNPLGVLERGYSIARRYPEETILMDAQTTTPGERLELILAKGRVLCQVEDNYEKTKNI